MKMKVKTPEQAAMELAAVLDEVSANIKEGRCHVSLETARFAIDLLTNRELSQDEAQSLLNMSRYSFENAVDQGRLPRVDAVVREPARKSGSHGS